MRKKGEAVFGFLSKPPIGNSAEERRRARGALVGAAGLAANFALFLAKITIGALSGSVSVTADAFNNLSDAAAGAISVFGFKMSALAPDREHPFGHGRSEYIAGFAVAFLTLVVGVEFVRTSFLRILSPSPVEINVAAVITLIASMLIKLWLWGFARLSAKATGSAALAAVAQDSLNDAAITGAALVSAAVSGSSGVIIDGYVGMAISVFIMWSGAGILRETAGPLLGEPANAELSAKICGILGSYPEIIGVHDLVLHNYGGGRKMATVHAEVDGGSKIVAIHGVIDEAERRIKDELSISIVIHADPVTLNDADVDKAREDLTNVLARLDIRLSMHDFRMEARGGKKNLTFDLVVPFEYGGDETADLLREIKKNLQKADIRYEPVITLDHDM
jgi:cation diffusion facilitator family transporter